MSENTFVEPTIEQQLIDAGREVEQGVEAILDGWSGKAEAFLLAKMPVAVVEAAFNVDLTATHGPRARRALEALRLFVEVRRERQNHRPI